MVATQLVAPPSKVVDDVPRLLAKTDVAALTPKKKATAVAGGESLLTECWDTCTQKAESGDFSDMDAYLIFGKFASRVVLLLVGKGNQGQECKVYESLTDIKKQFMIDAGLASAEPQSESTDGAQSESTAAAGFDDMSEPAFLANQAGFKVGQVYRQSTQGAAGRLLTLTVLIADGATFPAVSVDP